jgi:hypothetical protein
VWLWPCALALAVALAVATSEGAMGVAASPWGLAALGAVVAALVVLVLRIGDADLGRPGRLALALGLCALGLVGAQDFLRPGIPHGHDVGYHLWALWSTWRCVLDGALYPLWNPYLGLGMPLLQFYSPLSYVSAWPAQFLGASPVQALAVLMVGGQILCAVSAFAASRWLGASRAAAVLAAVVMVLAPYHLLNQTFRVALAENLALGLLPLLLAATWKVGRGERGPAAWVLGASAAALLLTHVLTLIAMLFVALPLLVTALLQARRAGEAIPDRLAVLGLCMLLTAGATAAWWLPVVVEVQHTAVSRLSRPGRAISPLAATALEPVQRRLWQRYGIRQKIGEVDDPGRFMPMYFGCVLLALVLLALCAPPRRSPAPAQPRGPHPRVLALSALLCLALAVDPGARLLDGMPLLGRIMFPWRLYGPATVFAALAAGLALDRWSEKRAGLRVPMLALALLAVAWDSSPYLGAAARYPEHDGLGAVAFAGAQVVPLDLPRDRFIRVEGLLLPPSDYDWRLAKSRRVFPEYMSVSLRERYGKISKPPSVAVSQGYHASFRVHPGRRGLQPLEPEPFVSFRPEGASYKGLAAARWQHEAQGLSVELPPGQVAGNVRVTEAWFPGWMARVDGGPWRRALRSRSLLAAAVPDGVRRVEFRYFASRPWYRGLAIGLSLLTLLGLAGALSRSRTSPSRSS